MGLWIKTSLFWQLYWLKISVELVPDLNKDVEKQSFWKELP